MSGKEVASAIRKELKVLYPNTKFSVVTSSYSAVRIKYDFGVPIDVIKAISQKYEMGYYDGTEDVYKYTNKNSNLPQCEYIFVERSETWNELQKLSKYVSKKFNVEFKSNVRDMVGYRWLDCLNNIELVENEDVESMYNRVRNEAIAKGLLYVVETEVKEELKEDIKQEVETKECVCPKCGNINTVETQWLNMLCMKCDYDTDNDDTVSFINGEIIKNEVQSSKWEKLNKEFDEKMSSISDDEMSNWIDKNKESNMSVKDVVEKMIESDDIQADEICYNTNEIAPQVVLQCPNCYTNNTIITGVKSFMCVKCGLTHEVYEHNGELKVLNITNENVNISNEFYNTKVEYNVKPVIEFKDYKNGYIISGTTDVDLVKQKLNDFNINKYVKIGIENELSEITQSRSVEFENNVQCFVECGRLIESLDNIVSQKSFIQTMQNEKVEIGDVICLLENTIIIISKKRNCLIML